VTNEAGCMLARKAANQSDNSYVQIALVVVVRTRVSKVSTRKERGIP